MPTYLKLILEIGPLGVFLLAFRWAKPEALDLVAVEALAAPAREAALFSYREGEIDALIVATMVFLAAFAVSMSVTYALERKVSKVAALTAAIVLVSGLLTVLLRDEAFIKMKPTLVNGVLGAGLAIGALRGRSYLKLVIGDALCLRDEGWAKLTRNWTIYFFVMALLNELVWRTQTTEFWIGAKLFLYMPITLLFTLSQAPLIIKFTPDAQSASGEPDEGASR